MKLQLAHTLNAIIDGINPAHPELHITEAEISIPLYLRLERGENGPVFFATPPFSAFKSGIRPVAHKVHIRLEQTAMQSADLLTLQPPSPVE